MLMSGKINKTDKFNMKIKRLSLVLLNKLHLLDKQPQIVYAAVIFFEISFARFCGYSYIKQSSICIKKNNVILRKVLYSEYIEVIFPSLH